jgi:hypothetical protein
VSAECETTRPAFSLNGPLGYLETLPLELKFAIFDYLSGMLRKTHKNVVDVEVFFLHCGSALPL